MSVNSSSNASLHSGLLNCSNSTVLIGNVLNATRAVLVLPLSIYVLYLGLQQWRQQRSSTSTSHCDVFTYHVAVLELIWALALAFIYCCSYTGLNEMVIVGNYLYIISFYGGCFFHALTCVERYLAVVHPITYLGLKNERGVRIRNISVGCVWLFCLLCAFKTVFYLPVIPTIDVFCIVVFALAVVSFCSISVLCVLIRPGPGEGGRDKVQVDQSKQRAFVTVMAIMGVLLVWFGGLIFSYVMEMSHMMIPNVVCVLRISVFWFNLPSSLVSPLLYLFRAGKLPCCCSNCG